MKFLSHAIFFITALLFVSCGNQEELRKRQEKDQLFSSHNGKIKVLSTTAIINELVKEVGKEHVNAIPLIKGDLDPHSYQLVKGDDEKLQKADIIFFNALGLEHGPSLQHYLYNSEKAVPLGNKIEEQDPSLILRENGQTDPHIWMDISLFSKAVPFIAEALAKKDPVNKEEYEKNALLLLSEMKRSDEEVKKLLLEIPENKRYLVTSHDAFNYFAKAYLATKEEKASNSWQKRFQAPEGLAPESQISASDIQYIIDHLYAYQIHVLFPESNVSQDSIRKILSAGKEKGLDLKISKEPLYGDAMGSPGSDGDTYLKMILHNAKVIANHLREP
ncbi:MAG TPA: zinc ABC transporter substrate-binding protein [Parachlamydiaceae bacterium]|nr:zinc ABC transporter substrate-binding protein [Parachlamydiaceae bacterium]